MNADWGAATCGLVHFDDNIQRSPAKSPRASRIQPARPQGDPMEEYDGATFSCDEAPNLRSKPDAPRRARSAALVWPSTRFDLLAIADVDLLDDAGDVGWRSRPCR